MSSNPFSFLVDTPSDFINLYISSTSSISWMSFTLLQAILSVKGTALFTVLKIPYDLGYTPKLITMARKSIYRVFSLTWPASMQIYGNKRKCLYKKRVQLPQDWFGTPTWPPFRCFGTRGRRDVMGSGGNVEQRWIILRKSHLFLLLSKMRFRNLKKIPVRFENLTERYWLKYRWLLHEKTIFLKKKLRIMIQHHKKKVKWNYIQERWGVK